jgi:hypothetical protein
MKTKVLTLILVICLFGVGIAQAQMGMRYLTSDEFGPYDEILKKYGRGDLKTIVAVVMAVDNQERVGLKCVNKKGTQYQVHITDGKIVKINKIQ